MKHLIYMICILFFVSSCDDMRNEPRVSNSNVQFEKNGGETTVKVTRYKGKEYSDAKAPWFYRPNNQSPILKTETLPNGDIKYFNDWLTFIVPPSFKSIKIIAKKNETNAKRSFVFSGWGDKDGFVIIVSQK